MMEALENTLEIGGTGSQDTKYCASSQNEEESSRLLAAQVMSFDDTILSKEVILARLRPLCASPEKAFQQMLHFGWIEQEGGVNA